MVDAVVLSLLWISALVLHFEVLKDVIVVFLRVAI
jgi:hypothetical protein